MKKRNPIAKNLNINKPKVIPDKRMKLLEKEQKREQYGKTKDIILGLGDVA